MYDYKHIVSYDYRPIKSYMYDYLPIVIFFVTIVLITRLTDPLRPRNFTNCYGRPSFKHGCLPI